MSHNSVWFFKVPKPIRNIYQNTHLNIYGSISSTCYSLSTYFRKCVTVANYEFGYEPARAIPKKGPRGEEPNLEHNKTIFVGGILIPKFATNYTTAIALKSPNVKLLPITHLNFDGLRFCRLKNQTEQDELEIKRRGLPEDTLVCW